MSDELRLVGAFGLSLGVTLALVPLVIRVALRTQFVDRPGGYKGHKRPTPYLGGMAVITAISVTLLVFGAAESRFGALMIWALVLFAVGTFDDKRNLSPYVRLVIEAGAAAALWHYGLGWAVFDSDVLNIALTILWVVGLVNAFNLMDNMDGAASTVAGVSAAGIAALGIIYNDIPLAMIGLAVTGACIAFLRFNLAKPARIFLGDGGSMPIGFLIAGAVMAVPETQTFGWSAVLVMAPIAGLPILDTTLVVISRSRAGRPVLSGGRDHLTHRLRSALGTPRLVALCLALVQAALCATALAAAQISALAVVVSGVTLLVLGGTAIYRLEARFAGESRAATHSEPASLSARARRGALPAGTN